jgi:hypothetical protein
MKREQGTPGARYTRGLVCNKRKRCAHEHTGEAEAFRHPLRNGFTVYSVLSPATNSSCHRHLRINGASRPVGRSLPPRIWRQQRASGPHGFTVREFRLYLWPSGLSRRSLGEGGQTVPTSRAPPSLTELIPPCDRLRALETAASTTFQAHVRDDRDTPSPRAGTRGLCP